MTPEQQTAFDKEYEQGDEMHVNGCTDCETYIVGDHRCACGNRRVEIVAREDLAGNLFFYAESY